MNVYESAFERRLRKALAELIEQKREALEAGMGVGDFPTYQKAVGYLTAMRDAIKIMEQVKDDLNREENMHAADGNGA